MVGKGIPGAFSRDLYRILQVDARATDDVIHAAYRALMRAHAPRKAGDDDAEARRYNEAYDILKNPVERRQYDAHCTQKSTGLIGPYRILHKVAEGGFGVTYKAEHSVNGGFSCIKHCSEISLRAEEILKRETSVIWDLRHYGLPAMRDLLQLGDGSYALAMSWIEGPTLEQLVEKQGPQDPENVAWITERLLNTLVYLHHHGVLHGDIKPQNIIIQEQTHMVVLVDFGLAMAKPSATSKSSGFTALYSPPEQMAGKTLVPGSDFYSLGMTMIHALGGGHRAVERKDVPASLPDPLCDFIRSLIARDVLHRPRSAEQLFEQLKQVRIKSFGRAHSKLKPVTA